MLGITVFRSSLLGSMPHRLPLLIYRVQFIIISLVTGIYTARTHSNSLEIMIRDEHSDEIHCYQMLSLERWRLIIPQISSTLSS